MRHHQASLGTYITITTRRFPTCYDDFGACNSVLQAHTFRLGVSYMATATSIADRNKINWNTSTFMAIFHVGAIAALFMFSWPALVATLVAWWVSGSLGIGMGFHRLLTHRGYKVPRVVEYFLTVCGLLALEGGAI